MKLHNRILSLVLCIILLFSMCACTADEIIDSDNEIKAPSNTDFWGKPSDTPSQGGGSGWDTDLTPDINVTIIGGGQKEDNMTEESQSGSATIYSMVTSAVTCDLNEAGFTTTPCVAMGLNGDFQAVGIGYYANGLQIFDDSDYNSVGFVSIINENEDYNPISYESDYIVVEPVNGEFDSPYNILAYTYDSIDYYHFVYENTYIIYYQVDSTTVRYETYENKRENYDLTLGSLYDFDNNQYIYDESIFGEYKSHSAIELFSEEDYAKLESELQVLSAQQLANGYEVLEFNIVYISPESIQAYLSSEEEDTFFGYNVDELASTFGLGTALTYNGTTFEKSTVIPEDEGYNWKSFLIKMGIGCGIILVGAILSPVTGGASFGCALLTISKVAVSFALTSAIGTLAIETVSGLIQGKSIEDALKNATHKGLDSFANGFMIGAAVGSVGLLTGAIKPSACFVAGTSIAMAHNVYKAIETIRFGDYVLSYNEKDGTVSRQKVIDTFSKQVYQTIGLTINGEYIETTYNHPFYSPIYNCWVEAGVLRVGDYVVDSNGNCLVVQDTQINNYANGVTVYNFTVENNHTYYVGESQTLVHNACDKIASERRKGVQHAWQQEKTAIKNNQSLYNWTSTEKQKILSAKWGSGLKGYDGCHIKDVLANPSLASNPNNIIFLKRYSSTASEISHFSTVHLGNWQNASTWTTVVKVMPQFAGKVAAIGGIV